VLYAIALGWPASDVAMRALGRRAARLARPITGVTLLGSNEKLRWKQSDTALEIARPQRKTSDAAAVFKIALGR